MILLTNRTRIGAALTILLLIGAGVFNRYEEGLMYGLSHLEPVHDKNVHALMGTPDALGIPTLVPDPIVLGVAPRYNPHFPILDFFKARSYSKSCCYKMFVKQKLPEGSYSVSVSSSHGENILPLEKIAPDLYVSSPLLILQNHASDTYYFGYGILIVDFGTEDTLAIKLERAVPGGK